MSEQKLQRIREVAADCPNPVAGKFINYDLGAAARNALPELLVEYDAMSQRAETAEAKLAAVPVSAIWRLYFKEFGLYPIEHYGPWRKIKAWLDTQPKPESPRE